MILGSTEIRRLRRQHIRSHLVTFPHSREVYISHFVATDPSVHSLFFFVSPTLNILTFHAAPVSTATPLLTALAPKVFVGHATFSPCDSIASPAGWSRSMVDGAGRVPTYALKL